jgi:hypothetical protein
MATEPSYTQDDNMVFLGRAVPQSLGAGDSPQGGSDTFATARGMFYQQADTTVPLAEVIWGPFPANVGFFYPNYQRRESIDQTVEASATTISEGGRNFFVIGYQFNTVEASGGASVDYYISWGMNVSGSLDAATLNTLPVSDEVISSTIIGTTVTFEHGSVTLTSASVRGPSTGLGDFIGSYSTTTPPFDPGYIVSITPA